MIDMRDVENTNEYKEAKKRFVKKFSQDTECHKVANCDKRWKLFKNAFAVFSNCKCPICETNLGDMDAIDHYRPKGAGKYEFVKCCCENYILICGSCNTIHKSGNFPLLDETQKAKSYDELQNEEPQLVNLRKDDIFYFFELHFKSTAKVEKIIEIAPNKNLTEPNDIEKAKKTIEIYGLGDCGSNKKISGCRISLFKSHFDRFINLAQAHRDGYFDITKEQLDETSKTYGFVKFIELGHYRILI